jgi:ketosteroid isomerase-like protein
VSQENVEIVKRVMDAFNRRDMDAAFDEVLAPDFELFPALVGAVEGGSFRGREGLTAYIKVLSEAWEEVRLCADEFRDLGDSVLVLGRAEGRGRGSGIEVDAPLATIYDCRDNKIWRSRNYLDHGEGLRAAGLAE